MSGAFPEHPGWVLSVGLMSISTASCDTFSVSSVILMSDDVDFVLVCLLLCCLAPAFSARRACLSFSLAFVFL